MPTAADPLTVVLVQPASWSRDGRANLRAVHEALVPLGPLDDRHIVVLPELVASTLDHDTYLHGLRQLAATSRAWVVGGSHHTPPPITNVGLVLAPDGTIHDRYQKRNPYGVEHDHGVVPGDRHATCRIAGHDVTVMICADAWFAELLLDPPTTSDLVIIPSFSITRRPPAFGQALWRHLAVARAYEFTTYVALADWRLGATYHGAPGAGTSGVADPWPDDPDRYFTPAADAPTSVHRLDVTKLRSLRQDRLARRFIRTAPASDL